MARADPKKWFPSRFSAQISLRKVDRWAMSQSQAEAMGDM